MLAEAHSPSSMDVPATVLWGMQATCSVRHWRTLRQLPFAPAVPTVPVHAGTGKTSTIVHAIRALVASGASVLVAAYTNSALDNILVKLAESGMHQFLRLGRASSCHTRVREYMPGGERCASISQRFTCSYEAQKAHASHSYHEDERASKRGAWCAC